MGRPVCERRSRVAGFTLVELLVVVSLTTIGFVAILNLQLGTIRGVGSARGMQGALGLAEHVAQTMRHEALLWTPSSPALAGNTAFTFLGKAPETTEAGTASEWLVGYLPANGTLTDARVTSIGSHNPEVVLDGTIHGYDAGIRTELGSLDTNYCVHYRLTWLVPNMLLRADIRVSWARANANFDTYQLCPVNMADRLDEVQSVSMPVTVLRNVFLRQV